MKRIGIEDRHLICVATTSCVILKQFSVQQLQQYYELKPAGVEAVKKIDN